MRGWGDNEQSLSEVVRLFNDTFPNRHINRSTVSKTIQRFQEIGTVSNRSRSGRSSSASNENNQLDVLQSFIANPHMSVRRAAQAHDIAPRSIHRILRKNFLYQIVFTDEATFRRWIGRRNRNEGGEDWLPRSPDLSPLDYYFWGYLRSKVYETKLQSIQELRQRIRDEAALLPAECNRRVFLRSIKDWHIVRKSMEATFKLYSKTLKPTIL
ncbi:hypothetical protein X777_01497 [Ooceraea biroi]|uniref:Uncharacterized protein n=1 Tax=Ooceraea biroi TaxID=2015173 RepID=A0A026WQV6_OOCBI|nr:hypothetical protein X777_01497 [Ooceraea biroi]